MKVSGSLSNSRRTSTNHENKVNDGAPSASEGLHLPPINQHSSVGSFNAKPRKDDEEADE